MSEADQLSEPEVIYKKAKNRHQGGHHGGSWKVAYADFVTAMMAFFLLMWLLGASDEQKKQGIANYFSPSALQDTSSGGGNGLLAGRSLQEPEGVAPYVPGSKVRTPLAANSARGGQGRGQGRGQGGASEQMKKVEQQIRMQIASDAGLKAIGNQIRFTQTPEGLQIDLIDDAKYSMFESSTTAMDPRTGKLLGIVANAIATVPNKITIRGHTDAHKFIRQGAGSISNNWALSTARAEATREQLARAGIPGDRFSRLEGVADTQPLVSDNSLDPRNRRISMTLLNE